MLVHERDPDLQRLTLMVADKDLLWYWKWLLDPFNGPGLVQTLTDNPTLHFTVEALDPQRVTAQSGARSAVYLERAGLLFKLLPLRISAGGPWTVRAGEPFNRQPGGESAIWLGTENILPTAVVKLGSATLPSAYAGPTGMSASIPGPLFDKSGVYPLYIEDPTTGMRSNVIDFRVTPRALTTLAPGVR